MANSQRTAARNETPERLVQQLRTDIVTRKYKPGEKISEEEVASRYDVSRGTVRSAFTALKNEGLIAVLPNGRREIIGVNEKFATDIYQLRWMIESHAVTEALHSDTSFFSPLLLALGEIEASIANADSQTDWYALDISFHRALVSCADSIPLLNAWEINMPVMYALLRLNTEKGYLGRYVNEFFAKHNELVKAIITGNPACYDMLKTHIMDALEISKDTLRKLQEDS